MRKVLLLGCLALAAVIACAQETNQSVLGRHAADLVVLKGETLVPFHSESFFKAPYTVLYFGAGWCPDCRRFSPALVSAYDHQRADAKRFEVLFLTMDKTAEGMLKFMQIEKMNWPALAFDKMTEAADLKKYYSGHGIPCLSVINQKGEVVLQSKSDQDARDVLDELQRMLLGRDASR